MHTPQHAPSSASARRVTNVSTVRKAARIWRFVAEFQGRNAYQKDRRALGSWMREEMMGLGPAFIKMGQFMSTRTDVFGADVTAELARLQDDSTPVPYAAIKAVIERELQRPCGDLFDTIEEVPIATASIGQVHRAHMRMRRGGARGVVIKVQKPDVAQDIQADLATLRAISRVFARLGARGASETETLLDQYDQFLTSELDYRRELSSMQRFREMFADTPNLRIPQAYASVSTERLLVMEDVPAIKITDVEKLRASSVDVAPLARVLVDAFLAQIIKHGVVHCDPHPGNIGVLPTLPTPTLVVYDFGNVVTLDPEFQAQINNIVVAVYQRDVDEFLDLLMKLRIVQVSDPIEALEIKAFFLFFFDYLQTVDFGKMRESIMSNDALRQATARFRVDNTFLALFRVFSLMDGTATLLDPDFNYIDALAPYRASVLQDGGFIQYRASKDLSKMNVWSSAGPLRSSEQNMLSIHRRVRTIDDRARIFRSVCCALIVLEHADDLRRMALVAPLAAWTLWQDRDR